MTNVRPSKRFIVARLLLLMVGTALCAATVGVAWATQAERRAPGLWRPAGPVT